MRVTRAAAVLGLFTPISVLGCGATSSDGSSPDSTAGQGAGGGVSSAGSTNSAGTAPSGGSGGAAGGSPSGGATTGGSPSGGATTGGSPSGGATTGGSPSGGATPSDDFMAPIALTLSAGFPQDVALGEWDDKPGMEVVVAGSDGRAYFPSDGAGHFGSSTPIAPAGADVDVLAVGHVHDGPMLDLLTAEANNIDTTVAFGDGLGTVAASTRQTFGAEGYVTNLFVADVLRSEQASQDFVVTCTGTVSVVVTTGNTGANFLAAREVIGAEAQDGVLAKLGAETWLVYSVGQDLYHSLVSYSSGPPSTVVIGTALTVHAGGMADQLDVGDFNQDAVDDVAVTLKGSGHLSVLMGDGVGSGGFVPTPTPLVVGDDPGSQTLRDVKVGDVNGDGNADVVASVQGLDAIAVFFGDGSGGFSGPRLTSTGAGTGPARLAVGDLNGDRADDVAVVGETSKSVIILLAKPDPRQ
jgi:hypothetical protein